jgi:hypothetical protein
MHDGCGQDRHRHRLVQQRKLQRRLPQQRGDPERRL